MNNQQNQQNVQNNIPQNAIDPSVTKLTIAASLAAIGIAWLLSKRGDKDD